MHSRSGWTLSGIAAAMIITASAGVADAALVTSLANPGFDDVPASDPAKSVIDWSEGESFADGAGTWPASILSSSSTFPLGMGDGSLGLTFNNLTDRRISYVYQSIGVIEASDVGLILSLSIEAQGRANNAPYEATVSTSFRTGATDGVVEEGVWSPELGTLLGTAGSRDFTAPDGASRPVLEAVPAAAYTVSADDIGREVFAVIALEGTSLESVNYKQFVLDNLEYAVVPEPASFAVLAAGGLLVGWRRRCASSR